MTDMIDLILSKDNVYIWNADDWLKLRKEHRIMGELIGCLAKQPRQDILLGLPLLLMPEEVSLLLEKKIARVIRYPCLERPPSEVLKKNFEKCREMLYVEQEECLREERKNQIMAVMDKIVEGKRRKILGIETAKKKLKRPLDAKVQKALDNIEINTTDLLNEEIAKLPKLEKTEALVQTHTAYPWSGREDVETVNWTYPLTTEHELSYRTFKDLWEQGYYVTRGEKFGGDFLAYPGDPIMFHSQFIIKCKSRDEEILIPEFIAECRIACHVRKTLVSAVFSEDKSKIIYQSFQWADSSVIGS